GPAAITRGMAPPFGEDGGSANPDLMTAVAVLSKDSSSHPALPAAPGAAALHEEQAPPLKAANVDHVFSSTVGEDQAPALAPPAPKAKALGYGSKAKVGKGHDLLFEPVGRPAGRNQLVTGRGPWRR